MPIVNTVFGRPGPHILAEPNDYAASEVENDSRVPGESVADAQDSLAAGILTKVQLGGALGGTVSAPKVVSIQGRAVQDAAPADGDILVWSELRQRWEPKAPPPIPTTFWTTLYDKDLRTLANQTISGSVVASYINFTADGQPWCVHASSGALTIVNGQGMIGTVNSDRASGNYYAGMHVCLKIYQMAGYDPAKEVAVQVRFAGVMDNATAIVGASVWASAEQWGYGPGDDNALIRWYVGSSEYQGLSMTQYPVGTVEQYASLVLASSQLPWQPVGDLRGNGNTNYRAGYFKRQVPLGVWPNMEAMRPAGGALFRTDIDQSKLKMGWYAGSAGGLKAVTATHIRVLQRPVA